MKKYGTHMHLRTFRTFHPKLMPGRSALAACRTTSAVVGWKPIHIYQSKFCWSTNCDVVQIPTEQCFL